MENVGQRKAVEVKVSWQGALIEERQFIEPERVTVGTSNAADIFMSTGEFGVADLTIVERDDNGFVVVCADTMTGWRRDRLAEGDPFSLSIGEVALEVRLVPAARPLPRGVLQGLDQNMINATLVTLFAAVTLVAGFALFPFDLSSRSEAAAVRNETTFVRLLNAPMVERRPEKIPVKPGGAPKLAGAPGKMGRPDGPDVNRRAAAKPQPADVRTIINNTGVVKFFKKGIFATILGRPVFGSDMVVAMGNVNGPVVGDARGLGGFAPIGDGPGGGGELASISLEKIRVGHGPGDGDGPGHAKVGPKRDADIDIGGGVPVVTEGLDKELVRRVIQGHRLDIKYCYEKGLVAKPALWGKVAVTFIVGAGGVVQSSRIKESTVGDAAVESCIAAKVKQWVFPEPKGGGVVVVSYPFILQRY